MNNVFIFIVWPCNIFFASCEWLTNGVDAGYEFTIRAQLINATGFSLVGGPAENKAPEAVVVRFVAF